MRDLLSKLDALISEETTLQDLKKEPLADDPVIAKAIKDKEKEEAESDKTDSEEAKEDFEIGDEFGISISEDFEIGTTIVDLAEDGVVIELDDHALAYLTQQGFTFEEGELIEEKQKGLDGKACWKGYRRMGTKMKGGKRVDNCVKVGESTVTEGENYSRMPADAIRTLYNVYKDESQGVRQHHDQEGAERIAKALNDTAQELDVSKYMRSLYNTAAGSARLDFDTDPGDFVNWFTYVGSALETLYKIHKEKGSYDDSSDFEVEKEGFENLIIEDRLSGFLNKLARFLVDLGFISTTITSNWSVESVLKAVIEEEDPATAAEARKMLTQFTKFSKSKELGDDLADAMFDVHGDIDDDDPYFYSDINTRHRFNKKKTEPDVEIDRESMEFEAEYQGRKVPLGKPMAGDVKKSKVYVKNTKGNVVKVNFGDKKMRIKKSNPNRRKSFRARHNCANPGPRWKARYWSCRAW